MYITLKCTDQYEQCRSRYKLPNGQPYKYMYMYLGMVDFCNALFQAGVCLFVFKFGTVANCDSHIIIIISPTCSSLWENIRS